MRDSAVIEKFKEHSHGASFNSAQIIWIVEFALTVRKYCKTWKDVFQVIRLAFPNVVRVEALERPHPDLEGYTLSAIGLYAGSGREVHCFKEDYLK